MSRPITPIPRPSRRCPVPPVKTYTIVSRAVEERIASGLRRAFKHTIRPFGDDIAIRLGAHIEQEVLNALCEVLDFD